MTRGLFCHYLPIYKDRNGQYCSTTLTNDLFKRYFCVVDELTVATRVYSIDKTFDEAHQELIDLPGVSFIEFPNLSSPKVLFNEYSNSKKILLDAISKNDMIIIRGGVIGIWAADIAKKIGKPYLVECAGCSWDEYWNYSLIGKLIAPYMEIKERQQIRNAAFVIYVTEKWLQERYPTKGKSTFASNVILKDIDYTALERRLKKISLFDPRKVIVIGTTGGIGNKAKGQQYVMKAISHLNEKYNIRYELVGGGDESFLKDTAKKMGIANSVFFKGQLTHEEVLEWLDSIDLYIQPSMQEGLPRSLIEAMSRACPSIGSTTGGIPELLQDDVIFTRGNASELERKIEYILNKDMSSYAEKNFKKACEFDISILNNRRDDLYRSYRNYCLGEK